MREVKRLVKDLSIAVRRRLKLEDHATVFEKIYKENKWLFGSGPGSTIEDTGPYREFLAEFLKSHDINSVLDLGCGDWQFSRLIDWGGIDYVGADVSVTAIRLAQQHATPKISFRVLNAIADPLPECDLLIAKDVLQHWSNQDIISFLPRLNKFRYALFTNGFPVNKHRFQNANIRAGKGRPIDLASSPFNLPGKYIFEYSGHEPKRVFFWQR